MVSVRGSKRKEEKMDEKIRLILDKIYRDPSEGIFSSYKPLYDKAKQIDKSITIKNVKDFLKDNDTHQVYHQRNIVDYPIRSWEPFGKCQMDLLDISAEVTNKNRGMKFIFCLIDDYTKIVCARPIKSKNDNDVFTAFKSVIDEVKEKYKHQIKEITSDNESSFRSKNFTTFCEENKIDQVFVDPGNKSAVGIIERFNRTLRMMIERYKSIHKTNAFIDVLPDLIKNYNTKWHRTLNQSPIKALESGNNSYYIKKQIKQVEKASEQPYNKEEYQVGDRVRLLIKKGLFDKGTKSNFTKTVHTILKIENGLFFVNGRKSGYKKQDLLKTVSKQADLQSGPRPEVVEASKDKKEKQLKRRLNKEGITENRKTLRRSTRERRPVNRIVNERGDNVFY